MSDRRLNFVTSVCVVDYGGLSVLWGSIITNNADVFINYVDVEDSIMAPEVSFQVQDTLKLILI